ncbi:hypothetical protein KIKIMORA_05200 [Brevundimonas phage vB_BpoS-Kikimora]|uniref:Uncharacterized protein n=2 Tax=Kikimoravirus TaxID=3425051 RepID=A0A9E7N552_9CAUD|nr:hypothetical protein KIKIMORA_05200 [Brevundimonas phage vB_BpoS-Kikimora]UTC28529.1 hypothetical protein GURKE_05270 [Brevundimonas phage vB_BpoS-Gurke]
MSEPTTLQDLALDLARAGDPQSQQLSVALTDLLAENQRLRFEVNMLRVQQRAHDGDEMDRLTLRYGPEF